jgi:hypothetical protein
VHAIRNLNLIAVLLVGLVSISIDILRTDSAIAEDSKIAAWVLAELEPSERVVAIEPDANGAFMVYACTASDSLGGRAIRVSRAAQETQSNLIFLWFQSEYSKPNQYIRVFDPVTLESARRHVEIVAKELEPDEYIFKVWLAERPYRNESGNIALDPASGVTCVSTARFGNIYGGREMATRIGENGTEAYLHGVRYH